METSKAGYLMSLAALQRQDPYINKLLDVTGQVALYTFNAQANEWEKTEIEGTLFVYARSASPHHGFTIMNRLSTENLVEPINKDLEFQLQDPFLLYRNANLGIYSIWFYDKKDCQRIARLMVKIVKQEAVQAQSASPERANGVAEPQPIDILELLSKAKEEYGRGQTGEKDVSGPAEQCQNPKELKSSVNSAEHAQNKPQPEKSSHTGLKQITVAELFGTSLQKDPSLPAMPTQSANSSDPSKPTTFLQLPTIPTSVPFNPLLPPHLTATISGASHQCHLPSYALHPSPIGEHQPQCSVSPLLAAPAVAEPHTPAPGTFLGQELLSKLKPPQPSVTPDLHRPMLAPSFLPSALITPQSFGEPIPMTTHAALGAMASSAPVPPQGKEVDVFSQPHNVVKPMPAVPLKAGPGDSGTGFSILLSPSAFQQSFPKATPVPRTVSAAAPPSSPPSYSTAGGESVHMGPCNKTQLQDTLIHLIKNDPAFLSAIHEAYLQSMCRDLSSLKL